MNKRRDWNKEHVYLFIYLQCFVPKSTYSAKISLFIYILYKFITDCISHAFMKIFGFIIKKTILLIRFMYYYKCSMKHINNQLMNPLEVCQ